MDRIAKDLFDSAFISRRVGDEEFDEAIKEARHYYRERINKRESELLVYKRCTLQLRSYLITADASKHYWIQQALDHSLSMERATIQEILESQNRYLELETYLRLANVEEDIECDLEVEHPTV